MKKFMKFGCLTVIGVFGFIVILGIIGMMFSDGEESTQTVVKHEEGTVETDSKEKDNKAVEANIGDTLKVGDVEFKVSEISKATNVGGEYGETSKGEYLIVKVSVVNKGSEALTVDSSFFNISADGKQYNADDSATMYANDELDFFYTEINPDLSLDGVVVFDLPKDVHSKDLTLNVQTGIFGTETGKINLK